MNRADGVLVGLIGSGIGPSLSPALHEREADQLGIRYLYRRWDLDVLGAQPDAVGELLATAWLAGYDGLNITHPCKQHAVAYLDRLTPEAAALGAVNTVTFAEGRMTGHNTDWSGFARGFTRGLGDVPLDRVALLGAGGAGAAAAYALLTLGAREVCVLDTDDRRSEALAAALGALFGEARVVAAAMRDHARVLGDADGLVHATPTGMAAHPGLPLSAELLSPKLWVAEIVYRPLETELIRAARERGCRVLDGGGMAVFQAVDAFRLFTGVEPDAERMLRHFRTLAESGGIDVHD